MNCVSNKRNNPDFQREINLPFIEYNMNAKMTIVIVNK